MLIMFVMLTSIFSSIFIRGCLPALLLLALACGPSPSPSSEAPSSEAPAAGSPAAGDRAAAAEAPDATDQGSPKAGPAAPASEGAATTGRMNVVDYYRSLEPPYDPGYPLKQSGDQWLTESLTGDPLEAVVDRSNGYIEIVDEGTGGGRHSVQVVLFRLAEGQPMIACTQTHFDGVFTTQDVFFLRPEHPSQYDWTEHTLGVITAYDFLASDYAGEPQLLEQALPVVIDLPQHGTTLTARLITDQRYLYCEKEDPSPAEQEACLAFDKVEKTSISLTWNRATGQFEW